MCIFNCGVVYGQLRFVASSAAMTLTTCYAGPGRRSRHRSSCDSLQRLRTPDHLPMNHNTTQAREQALQQRQRRMSTSHDVRKTCIDSGNLRQYSRRRFEFAVQNASSAKERDRVADIQRPHTTPNISCTEPSKTGPTRTGGLLYNRTPFILNAIRVRPQSESTKYTHTSPNYSDINRTLRQSNYHFTIRSTPVSRGQSMTSRSRDVTSRCSSDNDYVLIPIGDQVEPWYDVREFLPDDTEVDLCTDSNTWLPVPPRPQVILQVSADKYHSDIISDISSEKIQQVFSQAQNLVTGDVSGFPRSRPVSNEARTRLQVVSRPERPARAGSVMSMTSSVSSSESARSERSKCWVDDVTISSEVSEVDGDFDAADDTKQKQTMIATGKQKTGMVASGKQKSVMIATGKQKTKAEVKQVTAEEIGPADDTQRFEEEEEEEDQGDCQSDVTPYAFPSFLCPSSERKSRQAAIKLWLAKTSFTCAEKYVPLF